MNDETSTDGKLAPEMAKDKRTLAERKRDAKTRAALNKFCKGLKDIGVLGGPHCIVAEYQSSKRTTPHKPQNNDLK